MGETAFEIISEDIGEYAPGILKSVLNDWESSFSINRVDLALRLLKENTQKDFDDELTCGELCTALSGFFQDDGNSLGQCGKSIDYLLEHDPTGKKLKKLVEINPGFIAWDLGKHGEKLDFLLQQDPTGKKISELMKISPHLVTLGMYKDNEIKGLKQYISYLNYISKKDPEEYLSLVSTLRGIFKDTIVKGSKEVRGNKIDHLRKFYIELVKGGIKKKISRYSTISTYSSIGVVSFLMIYANENARGDSKVIKELSGKEVKDYIFHANLGCTIDRLNSRWLHEITAYFGSGTELWRELKKYWTKPGFSYSLDVKPESKPVWKILEDDHCWATKKHAEKRMNKPWSQQFVHDMFMFADLIDIDSLPRYKYQVK